MVARVDKAYWLVPSLVAFCLCLRAVSFDFVFDDQTLIVLNPQVHSWDYLPRLLTTHLWSHWAKDTIIPQYRPVFSVWLLTMYTLGGLSKWFWHLSSILLHSVATYQVFCLALEISDIAAQGSILRVERHTINPNLLAASGTALLFAVHPIHIEPVSWVSSCNELLYTNLVLLSLLLFCRALRRFQSRKSWNWRTSFLSVIAWTAAIFTKESSLPVLAAFFFLAYKSTNTSQGWKERLLGAARRGLPYLIMVFVYFAARFLVIGKIGLDKGGHSWAQVLYSAPSILVFYLQKLSAPVGLSGFYMNTLLSAPTLKMWVTLSLILPCLSVLAWLSLRRSAAIGLASMLLFLPMLPVLAGIKVFLEGDLAHDRYMYLPSVGLCLFVGIWLKALFERSKVTRGVAIAGAFAAIVILGSLTLAQQGYYRDEKAYFGRGLEVRPDNVLVIDYLGNSYLRDGNTQEALRFFKRAHELKPDDARATFCLARGYVKDGQFETAEPYLEQLTSSKELTPYRRNITYLMLGQTEMKLNHLNHAESVLRQLSSEDPTAHGAHYSLGYLYQSEGRFLEAQSEYMREYEISQNSMAAQRAVYLSRLTRVSPQSAGLVDLRGTSSSEKQSQDSSEEGID